MNNNFYFDFNFIKVKKNSEKKYNKYTMTLSKILLKNKYLYLRILKR